MLCKRVLATMCVVGVSLLGVAQAAEIHVGSTYSYSSIASALSVASANDTITVHAGTYVEGQLNITQQNLLVRGAVGEARPTLVSTAGQYSNSVVINADGITLQGLEMTHQSGDHYGYGVGDGNATSAHSGWSVEDCVIHDMRSAVWNNKMSNFNFSNNEVYNNYSKRLYLEATESFTCTGNFFHSATRTSGQGVIWWATGDDPDATGDTEIAYNYISGGRAAIVIEGGATNSPSGSRTLTVEHNTLDGMMGQFNESGDYSSQLLSFWDNSGSTYDASKIDIRDNLFVESLWYAIYNGEAGTGGLAGDLAIESSLFFNNYSEDGWYPDYAYPEEWPGPRGQVGWTTTGDDFVFSNSYVLDPLLARTGTTAEEYYALLAGSPAFGTASDGTNIGAFQGSPAAAPIPEPATISLLAIAGAALIYRKRKG